MPAQLSKFSFEVPCRDYVHPWTESCVSATTGLGLHCLQESLRIYTTVYIIAFLMRRKRPTKEDVKKTMLGILQSTAFLSWSAFSYSMWICLLRQALGRFYIPTVSFLPSFLSSLSAIVIERASRRTLLCLYVSNVATETLFKMGLWRKYYSPISRGEVYIFAVSVAVLLYFFRSKTNKQDQVYKIFRMIIGRYEETEYLKKKDSHPETSSRNIATDSAKNDRSIHRNSFLFSLSLYIANIMHVEKNLPQRFTHLCYSCWTYCKRNIYGISQYYYSFIYHVEDTEIKWFASLLYCFSTAVLFHAAIVEPQNLRSSYWRFLYTVSGGRIAVMSRLPMNVFGLETHKNLQEVLRKTKTTDQLTFSF